MVNKWNQLLEDAILGKLVAELIGNGYNLEIETHSGQLHVYGWPVGEARPENGFSYWVRCQPGNGVDLIVDYSTNLEQEIAQTNLFVKSWEE